MFLRGTIRKKNGKEHRYWSIVENKRVAGGKVRQRHVLYLGEINASQERAWRKSIEVLDEQADRRRTLALFPEDRCDGLLPDSSIVRLRLSQLRLYRPRQWGACWLALKLWEELPWRLVVVEVAEKDASFSYRLDRDKLRKARRREGRYLLRTNLTEQDPTKLWSYYLQLVAVEEAFKNLKGDLALRPIHHQREERIEAHIFIAFLAYCLQATLRCRLQGAGTGAHTSFR